MTIKLLDLLQEVSSEEKYQKILDSNSYEAFVKNLKTNINDPKIKYLLQAGLRDGSLTDDTISYGMISTEVSKLSPTQNEIDADKSLEWLLSGKSDPNNILNGGSVTLGVHIITGSGKYVIDGHHRWSQIYVLNPACKANALDVSGLKNWVDILKAVQTAVAVELGRIQTKSVKGTNLYGISKNKLEEIVKKYLIPSSAGKILHSTLGKKYLKKQRVDTDSPIEDFSEQIKLVSGFIWENIQVMKKKSKPVSGAGSRGSMPQTDTAPHFAQNLGSGEVNFNRPYFSK